MLPDRSMATTMSMPLALTWDSPAHQARLGQGDDKQGQGQPAQIGQDGPGAGTAQAGDGPDQIDRGINKGRRSGPPFPSATPAPAAGAAATKRMDGRRSLAWHWRGAGRPREEDVAHQPRLGFVDQAQGGGVQAAQFRLRRFVFGELDQVATGQEIAPGFAFARRSTDSCPAIRERNSSVVRSGAWKLKRSSKYDADGAGNGDGKGLGLADERQSACSRRATGPHMGRNGRNGRDGGGLFAPVTPGQPGRGQHRQNSDDPEKPQPAVGNVDERFEGVVKNRAGPRWWRRATGAGTMSAEFVFMTMPWRRRFSRVSKNLPRARRVRLARCGLRWRRCWPSATGASIPPDAWRGGRQRPGACGRHVC